MKIFSRIRVRFAFPQIWALFAIALIAATRNLWFPTFTDCHYPAVPWFQLVSDLPSWLLDATSLVLLVSLLGVVVVGDRSLFSIVAWWGVVLSLAFSFALDQHRMQPWAYQLAIYALMFATLDSRRRRGLIIPFAASIYIYSAMGKFDFQFTHTVGQDFLNAIARPFGGLPDGMDVSTLREMGLSIPDGRIVGRVRLVRSSHSYRGRVRHHDDARHVDRRFGSLEPEP